MADAPMVQIGTTEDGRKSFESVAQAVLSVITAGCGDEVKKAALEVLGQATPSAPEHVSISNCVFTQGDTKASIGTPTPPPAPESRIRDDRAYDFDPGTWRDNK